MTGSIDMTMEVTESQALDSTLHSSSVNDTEENVVTEEAALPEEEVVSVTEGVTLVVDDKSDGTLIADEKFDEEVMQMQNAYKKKLLVLDINGLLLDTYFVGESRPSRPHDAKVGRFFVYKRPYCDQFLEFCLQKFLVGVWSSAREHNVNALVEYAFGSSKKDLAFSWNQSQCTDTGVRCVDNRYKPLFLKELSKLWMMSKPDVPWDKGDYGPWNTLLVDDSPYKTLRNPAYTAVLPMTYSAMTGDADDFLPNLQTYLEKLQTFADVQKFVEMNPIGQAYITTGSPNWEFYLKVKLSNVMTDSPSGKPLENTQVSVPDNGNPLENTQVSVPDNGNPLENTQVSLPDNQGPSISDGEERGESRRLRKKSKSKRQKYRKRMIQGFLRSRDESLDKARDDEPDSRWQPVEAQPTPRFDRREPPSANLTWQPVEFSEPEPGLWRNARELIGRYGIPSPSDNSDYRSLVLDPGSSSQLADPLRSPRRDARDLIERYGDVSPSDDRQDFYNPRRDRFQLSSSFYPYARRSYYDRRGVSEYSRPPLYPYPQDHQSGSYLSSYPQQHPVQDAEYLRCPSDNRYHPSASEQEYHANYENPSETGYRYNHQPPRNTRQRPSR